MNLAHLHLLINHFPITGIVFTILLLLAAIVTRSLDLKRASFVAFVLLAFLALPVYFTGEPAEEIIEDLPGVSESIIEEHEDAAVATLVVFEVLGVVGVVGLLAFRRRESIPAWFVWSSFVLLLVGLGFIARTANLGGQIRHIEARPDFQPAESFGEE